MEYNVFSDGVELEVIDIYTDGACIGNPGPGGWAAVIVEDGKATELSGREADTTNNRMEMTAVISGLDHVRRAAPVTVSSDSTYVVSTMTRSWKRRANHDLWSRLDLAVAGRDVRWKWVRGHSGHPMNERADALARREAKRLAHPPKGGALSHVDESGEARMVDVGAKPATERVAEARGTVYMRAETLALIETSGLEKGDVLGAARIAGIMAAKSTAQLIPMCHPIPLDNVAVELKLDRGRSTVEISATAKTTAKTGVEMEAMTAVSVAALTVYDMCKSADRGMRIGDIRLARKAGGKSGDIVLEE